MANSLLLLVSYRLPGTVMHLSMSSQQGGGGVQGGILIDRFGPGVGNRRPMPRLPPPPGLTLIGVLYITPTFPVDGFAFPSNNIYLVQASFNSGHFINHGRVKGLSAVFNPAFDHPYLEKAVLNSQRIAAIERCPLFVFFHKPANSIGFKRLQSIQVVLNTRRTWQFWIIRWRWRPRRLA